MEHPRDHLCFALDVARADHARHLVGLLAEEVGMFKVGLEFFLREGPSCIRALKAWGAKRIFLDLKFFDIPRTIRGACTAAAALDVDFVSVHCEGLGVADGGRRPQGVPPRPAQLGVTLLTSISPADMAAYGYRPDLTPSDIVLMRAELARAAGCAGVVCAAGEAGRIRQRYGPGFVIVTPGIRPGWARVEGDDQQRVCSPYQAIEQGADYIVVGRPIRDAADPAQAAAMISEEIGQALRETGRA
jgi:orotidine-5'-phosphate decarboxylase